MLIFKVTNVFCLGVFIFFHYVGGRYPRRTVELANPELSEANYDDANISGMEKEENFTTFF